jgi:hypothetical protein
MNPVAPVTRIIGEIIAEEELLPLISTTIMKVPPAQQQEGLSQGGGK